MKHVITATILAGAMALSGCEEKKPAVGETPAGTAGAMDAVKDAAKDAGSTVSDAASKATEAVKETAKEATEATEAAVEKATDAVKETADAAAAKVAEMKNSEIGRAHV